MLKVEYDAETRLYKRNLESPEAKGMLVHMTMIVIAFSDDIRETLGEKMARDYRKVLRNALDVLDEEEERGQVLQ